MKQLKWSSFGLKGYKETGEKLKALGYKAIRDIQDVEVRTALTFWSSPDGTIIQQTWADTGDICLYRSVSDIELDGMKAASEVSA